MQVQAYRAHRTATQYDRLFASSCRPPVCPTLCIDPQRQCSLHG